MRVVLDTNVIVAALKSSSGASHELLLRASAGDFEIAVSVPLIAEYEDVTSRPDMLQVSARQVDAVLDHLCQIGINQRIHFLWRPYLNDPKDDMVFETALAAGASAIVTFNLKDFKPITEFGIQPLTPGDFLLKL